MEPETRQCYQHRSQLHVLHTATPSSVATPRNTSATTAFIPFKAEGRLRYVAEDRPVIHPVILARWGWGRRASEEGKEGEGRRKGRGKPEGEGWCMEKRREEGEGVW